MRLLFATHNAHKAEELLALLRGALEPAPTIVTLRDLGLPEPVEDGETFEANARIKAAAAHGGAGLWSLADDSGLLVDALGGAPGVHSAYFGGLPRSDERNLQKLLQVMEAHPRETERAARFRCVLCLRGPGGFEALRSGTVEGTLLRERRGGGGFGYDPIFVPSATETASVGVPAGLTLAELSARDKNRLSHRARAVHAMVPVLAEMLRARM